jgi:hypothetical protein
MRGVFVFWGHGAENVWEVGNYTYRNKLIINHLKTASSQTCAKVPAREALAFEVIPPRRLGARLAGGHLASCFI